MAAARACSGAIIHGVTGFWISGLALFLLLSGLPWAKFWGDYFKNVRRLTGTAVARQDWTNGQASTAGSGIGEHDRGEHSEPSADESAGAGPRERTPSRPAAVDRIVATRPPARFAPARGHRTPRAAAPADWTAKSMTPNRPRRVDLVVDGATGAIKDRKDFKDRHLIDRIVGTGIAAHEGQLFGWPNQLLGLVTATGPGPAERELGDHVVATARGGRPRRPKALMSPRVSLGFLFVVLLFGVYLPMFGASLLAVLLLETLLLRRIPRVREWLGLRPPRQEPVPMGTVT